MRPDAYLETALTLWQESREVTTCTVTGSCMSPLLRTGDRVVIRHGDRRLRRGDIVVVQSADGYQVQRLIVHEPDGTWTVLSDRLSRPPRTVWRSDIVGKVIALERGDRRIGLESRLWRGVGHLTALRGYCSYRCERPRHPGWRCLAALCRARVRLLPRHWNLGLLPLRAAVRLRPLTGRQRTGRRRPAKEV